MSRSRDSRTDPTRWIVHGERLVDDTRRLRLSVAQVELPDGVRFEQYVLLTRFQPLADTADFENLLYLGGGAEDTGKSADANEAARVEWIALDSVRDRIAQGEIVGAGTQIGLLHVLAFHAGQAR